MLGMLYLLLELLSFLVAQEEIVRKAVTDLEAEYTQST
jgi:hypothetical protein